MGEHHGDPHSRPLTCDAPVNDVYESVLVFPSRPGEEHISSGVELPTATGTCVGCPGPSGELLSGSGPDDAARLWWYDASKALREATEP